MGESVKDISSWLEVSYVVSSLLFILAILGLGHQTTARAGNYLGVCGMLLCTISVYFWFMDTRAEDDDGWWLIPTSTAIGGAIGVYMAQTVQMTGMPQMVGLFNAFGGLAAALESIALYVYSKAEDGSSENESRVQMAFLLISLVVGMVTFFGSLIACGKLDGQIRTPNIANQHLINFTIYAGVIALMILCGLNSYEGPDDDSLLLESYIDLNGIVLIIALTILSSICGVVFVLPIGGADMPVVISVLNAFSGLSGCAAGFMLENDLLIITGALVASSGAILSYIMCKAMNRSLMNVLAGGFGEGAAPKPSASGPVEQQEHYPIDTDGVSNTLLAAKNVLIVPGYGMAVSRAQHTISEIVKALNQRGVSVKFGIHPVAGRLPGHMNVLLAEARVPYEIVLEMDEVNPDMSNVDVVLVIGANDTVNPAAEEDPSSAIAGMPVIRVWLAKTVIVMKRSMSQGYAAVDNPLFFRQNSRMYFGDAKKNCDALLEKIRSASASASGAGVSGAAAKAKEKEEPLPPAVMKLGVMKETADLERRVACIPDMVKRFRKLGFDVLMEEGAGVGSGFPDALYAKSGAHVVDLPQLYEHAQVILKVEKPTVDEIRRMKAGQVLISYVSPAHNKELLQAAAETGITLVAMDAVPRVTAAQKLDSLSSMGKISGYRAVVEASNAFERFFVGEITAAGKYPPATFLIIGAGVAGLAAIGAAKAMGAVVRCFDTRLVTKEQVESMGAEFLKLTFDEDGEGQGGYAKVMSEEFYKAEMELFAQQAAEVDIIITTAQIPGSKAPILIKKEHVEAMKPGSVVVDIAAMSGGNCELTAPGKVIEHKNVKIIGYTDLTSRMAYQASAMYSTNLQHLLHHMGSAEKWSVNMQDEVVRPMVVAHQGQITYPPPRVVNPSPAAPPAPKAAPKAAPKPAEAE
eukprot:TRINITY_DN275_c0_g1_i2.p1 TRINITY_DN275_c0_g1~~TRINITY_DN275_c0_g1_i2.p1  ORF type:complete len:918 (+),score=217.34 TRINITY_DN275_c0_g1_i2:81-2834(+)